MTKETALIWSYLNVLNKKRYDVLLQQYNTLDEALQNLTPEMLKALGCKDDTMYTAMNRFEEVADPSAYAAALRQRGLSLLSIEDEQYPAALKLIPDAPVFLYYKGSLDVLRQPCIGCVGSREMSDYGKRVVEEFVPAFVRSGMTTVSGLARGVDALCADETLRANGTTVAVLGHGLGTISPKENKQLAERIVEAGGLLLSEYPLDASADRYTFPARNRIIAALSLGTVVLQAAEGSGALITADLALEYNKDVFAVPGQIFDPSYAGSHQYISAGRAKLVSSPQEVLRDIGIVSFAQEERTEFITEDDTERALYEALTSMPQSVSDLTETAQLDAAIVTAKLTMLELNGVAKNTGNGLWVKV